MGKISALPTDTAPLGSDVVPFLDVSAGRTEGATFDDLAASAAFAALYAPTTALNLPGTSGNYVSTPDVAALDLTGDMEIVCRVGLSDWTPATTMGLVSKRDAGQEAYSLQVLSTTGVIRFVRWVAASPVIYAANGMPALMDGAVYWLRVTFDQNNGAGSSVASFYYAIDQSSIPTSWTQIGSSVTSGNTTATDATTATVNIGTSQPTTEPVNGKVLRAIIYSDLAGTKVADWRGDAPMGTRYLDSTNKVWTINGSTWSWVVVNP